MICLFANNAQSTLAGSISNSAVTCNLQAGGGAQFPNPTVGEEYFRMTFTDAATGLISEIVEVTHRVGDTLTIVRGQEGTSAVAWAANDLADNMMTAGTAEIFVQDAQAQAQGYNYGVDIGSANVYQASLSPPITVAPTVAVPFRILILNANSGASTLDAGWGAVAIRRANGSALIGGELIAGQLAEFLWNPSTARFQFVYPAAATAAAITTGTDTKSYVTPAQLRAAVGTSTRPTSQTFMTPGAFTYTPTSADVLYIQVRFVGAGGGGGGTGLSTAPNGSSGGDTIFNSVHAKGGGGGTGNATASGLSPSAAGIGGTGGTGTATTRIPGQAGQVQALSSGNGGGGGGSAPFFGGGAQSLTQDAASDGLPGQPNTGGGGGGSFSPGSTQGAAGGGSGEYAELWLDAPGSTYSGTIGAGGAGGIGTGTGAKTGGAGAGGKAIVTEFYN